MFLVEDLVANGDLTSATTSLTLRDLGIDGCTSVKGAGPVIVVPGS